MEISAIVPVRNAAGMLDEVLQPLAQLRHEGELCELLVVDDGSIDESAAIARAHGAEIVTTTGSQGPASARNLAAQSASGDILWFIDADVIAPLDGPGRLRDAFVNPDVVAAFGSYDLQPRAPNFLSQYKNLAHHFYHQHGDREAATFWAGCGAVRAGAFRAAHGFDTERFARPSIEDIELGYRLRDRGGRIRLLPELRATHLKEWRLRSLVSTDIFQRAIPWTRLLIERGGVGNDLNVARGERVRAALAIAAWLVLLGLVVGIVPWWMALAVWLTALGANFRLGRCFYRRHGVAFALSGLFFQQFYYLYSSVAFMMVSVRHRVGPLISSRAASRG